MRRLFLLLDLSVLKGPGRSSALQQLATALPRSWAVYQAPDLTWGYALYDSTSPALLLRARIRRTAAKLQLKKDFQDSSASDLRGEELPAFLALLDKLSDDEYYYSTVLEQQAPPASEPPAAAPSGEPPVRALDNALQAALGGSFLRKLKEVAEHSAGSGGTAEGLVLLVTPALTTQVALHSFLGLPLPPGGSAGPEAADASAVAALLAKHLPLAALLRCGECCASVAWVAAEPALGPGAASGAAVAAAAAATRAAGSFGQAALEGLRAALAQGGVAAAAAELAELAAEGCHFTQFPALLGLAPGGGQQPEVTTEQRAEQAEQGAAAALTEDVWPGGAESFDQALDDLRVLLVHLAGASSGKRDDDIRRRVRQRMRDQQRAAREGGAAAGLRRQGRAVPPRGKGQAAVEHAKKLQAEKESRRNALGSQPNTAPGSQATGAGGSQGAAGEEVESVAALPLEAAAEELASKLEAHLLELENQQEDPSGRWTAEVAARTKALAYLAFAAVRKHAQQEGQAPFDPDSVRSMLLSRAAAPAAAMTLELMAARQPEEQRRFRLRVVAQLLLRLSLCGAGRAPGQELPRDQLAEVEGLLRQACGALLPIPRGGYDFFTGIVRPAFGAKFPGAMRHLAHELWEDDMDLFEVDAFMQANIAEDIAGEESGETPGIGAQPSGSLSGNPQRSGSMRTGDTTAGRAGPSNLGRPPQLHREVSLRDGVHSTRPSLGAGASGSQSRFSGDNSGVHTGGGSGGGGWGATSRAATSRGLPSQHQLRMRALALGQNNSYQFTAQRQFAAPRQDKKLVGAGRGAPAGRPRAPGALPQHVNSRGAAQVARAKQQQQQAASKGAVGGSQGGQPKPPHQRVPDTPESIFKQLPKPPALQLQLPQQPAGEDAPIFSPGAGHSPAVLRSSAAWGEEGAIPDTDPRPPLEEPPQLAAAMAQLRRLSSRNLFGEAGAGAAPGAIPTAMPLDSPTSAHSRGGSGSAAASPQAAAGPTWLMPATQPVRAVFRAPSMRGLVLPTLGSQPQQQQEQRQQQQEAQPPPLDSLDPSGGPEALLHPAMPAVPAQQAQQEPPPGPAGGQEECFGQHAQQEPAEDEQAELMDTDAVTPSPAGPSRDLPPCPGQATTPAAEPGAAAHANAVCDAQPAPAPVAVGRTPASVGRRRSMGPFPAKGSMVLLRLGQPGRGGRERLMLVNGIVTAVLPLEGGPDEKQVAVCFDGEADPTPITLRKASKKLMREQVKELGDWMVLEDDDDIEVAHESPPAAALPAQQAQQAEQRLPAVAEEEQGQLQPPRGRRRARPGRAEAGGSRKRRQSAGEAQQQGQQQGEQQQQEEADKGQATDTAEAAQPPAKRQTRQRAAAPAPEAAGVAVSGRSTRSQACKPQQAQQEALMPSVRTRRGPAQQAPQASLAEPSATPVSRPQHEATVVEGGELQPAMQPKPAEPPSARRSTRLAAASQPGLEQVPEEAAQPLLHEQRQTRGRAAAGPAAAGTPAAGAPTDKTPLPTLEGQEEKDEYGEEIVGRLVEVFWSGDKQYYTGTVTQYHQRKREHTVKHDDGEIVSYRLAETHFKFLDAPGATPAAAQQAIPARGRAFSRTPRAASPAEAPATGGRCSARGAGLAGETEAAEAPQSTSRQGRTRSRSRVTAGGTEAAVVAVPPSTARRGRSRSRPAAGSSEELATAEAQPVLASVQGAEQACGEDAPRPAAAAAEPAAVAAPGAGAGPLGELLRLECGSCPAGSISCAGCNAAAAHALEEAGLGFLLPKDGKGGLPKCRQGGLPGCTACWARVASMLERPAVIAAPLQPCTDHQTFDAKCKSCRPAAAAALAASGVPLVSGCSTCRYVANGCGKCLSQLERLLGQVASHPLFSGAAAAAGPNAHAKQPQPTAPTQQAVQQQAEQQQPDEAEQQPAAAPSAQAAATSSRRRTAPPRSGRKKRGNPDSAANRMLARCRDASGSLDEEGSEVAQQAQQGDSVQPGEGRPAKRSRQAAGAEEEQGARPDVAESEQPQLQQLGEQQPCPAARGSNAVAAPEAPLQQREATDLPGGATAAAEGQQAQGEQPAGDGGDAELTAGKQGVSAQQAAGRTPGRKKGLLAGMRAALRRDDGEVSQRPRPTSSRGTQLTSTPRRSGAAAAQAAAAASLPYNSPAAQLARQSSLAAAAAVGEAASPYHGTWDLPIESPTHSAHSAGGSVGGEAPAPAAPTSPAAASAELGQQRGPGEGEEVEQQVPAASPQAGRHFPAAQQAQQQPAAEAGADPEPAGLAQQADEAAAEGGVQPMEVSSPQQVLPAAEGTEVALGAAGDVTAEAAAGKQAAWAQPESMVLIPPELPPELLAEAGGGAVTHTGDQAAPAAPQAVEATEVESAVHAVPVPAAEGAGAPGAPEAPAASSAEAQHPVPTPAPPANAVEGLGLSAVTPAPAALQQQGMPPTPAEPTTAPLTAPSTEACAAAASGALPQLSPLEWGGPTPGPTGDAAGESPGTARPAGRLTEGKAAAVAAPAASPEAAAGLGEDAATPPSAIGHAPEQPPPASLQHQTTHKQLPRQHSMVMLPLSRQQQAAAAEEEEARQAGAGGVHLTPTSLFGTGARTAPAGTPRWQARPTDVVRRPPAAHAHAAPAVCASPPVAAGPLGPSQSPLRQAGSTPLAYRPCCEPSQGPAAAAINSQAAISPLRLLSPQPAAQLGSCQQWPLRYGAPGPEAEVPAGSLTSPALPCCASFPQRGDLVRHLSKPKSGSPAKEARLLLLLTSGSGLGGGDFLSYKALQLNPDEPRGQALAQEASLLLQAHSWKAPGSRLEKQGDWSVEGQLPAAEVKRLEAAWQQQQLHSGAQQAQQQPSQANVMRTQLRQSMLGNSPDLI